MVESLALDGPDPRAWAMARRTSRCATPSTSSPPSPDSSTSANTVVDQRRCCRGFVRGARVALCSHHQTLPSEERMTRNPAQRTVAGQATSSGFRSARSSRSVKRCFGRRRRVPASSGSSRVIQASRLRRTFSTAIAAAAAAGKTHYVPNDGIPELRPHWPRS